MAKKKIGGFKKKRRAHRVSKGLRRSIAKPHGQKPNGLGAHRCQ